MEGQGVGKTFKENQNGTRYRGWLMAAWGGFGIHDGDKKPREIGSGYTQGPLVPG